MKKTMVNCVLACLAASLALECVAAESSVSAVSRMESRTKDPTRDPGLFGDYWWANRFLSRSRLVEGLKGKTVDVVMLGDSIMHFWEWHHPKSWAKFTKGRTVLNLGYGGDKTQNVLWRMEHGELDGYTAKCIVLMIGTNNNSANDSDPAAVAEGVKKIVAGIRRRQPKAKVILHPIFPRGCSAASAGHAAARSRNDKTNAALRQFAKEDGKLVWVDFNDKLVDKSGWVPRSLMADEIHPTDAGYDIWMAALAPHLAGVNAAPADANWRVSVDGREIPLRTCPTESWAPYAFGSFEVAGGERVVVTSPRGVVERFVAEKPFRRIFDPDHRKSVLVLFGDAPETDVPDRSDPKVKWFGPGEHHAGGISLKDGETLYLERGAVVYGGLHARGRDITVAGRGILTGAGYPKCKGPFPFFAYFDHCTNLIVRGVTLTRPYHWTLVVSQSRKVLIEDVRLCAGNILNDDGIDLINTSEATIRNVFVRTQDDAIAVKGMDFRPPAERSPCEDILVENCTLWVDHANVFRIGFESNASAFRRLTFRDVYVHAYSKFRNPVDHLWAHAVVWLQPSNGLKISDVRFEDLHVRSDGSDMPLVIAEPRLTWCSRIGPGYDPYSGKVEREFYKTGGSIDGVTFRRMTVDGEKGEFHGIVHAKGRSPTEAVSNLRFEDCTRFGEPLTAKSPHVTVGEFSSAQFAAGAASK